MLIEQPAQRGSMLIEEPAQRAYRDPPAPEGGSADHPAEDGGSRYAACGGYSTSMQRARPHAAAERGCMLVEQSAQRATMQIDQPAHRGTMLIE
jgi:hypothetical protein